MWILVLLGLLVLVLSYFAAWLLIRLLAFVFAQALQRAEARRLRAAARALNGEPYPRGVLLIAASALISVGASQLSAPGPLRHVLLVAGALGSVASWILHGVPGHNRTLKYVVFIASSTAISSAQRLWIDAPSSTVTDWHPWFWMQLLVVLLTAAYALVRLQTLSPLEPGTPSSNATLRWYQRLTGIQGPDVLSVIVWSVLSFTGLAVGYVVLRFCVGERMSTRPFLYLRSFSHQDTARIFRAVIMPGLYRCGAVSGLVHARQPSTDLQAGIPVLWRAHFKVVGDDEWKGWVKESLAKCTGVIVDLSEESESLRWELESAVSIVDSNRILVLQQDEAIIALPAGAASINLRRCTFDDAANAVAQWGAAVASSRWRGSLKPRITHLRRQILHILLAIILSLSIGGFTASKLYIWLMVYDKRPRALPVERSLTRIARNASAYWVENFEFPPSIGPTPATGTCCASPERMCRPESKLWANPTWMKLHFSVDDDSSASAYSYAFESDASGFTARAIGDLSCSGDYETLEVAGRVINGELKLGPIVTRTADGSEWKKSLESD